MSIGSARFPTEAGTRSGTGAASRLSRTKLDVTTLVNEGDEHNDGSNMMGSISHEASRQTGTIRHIGELGPKEYP